MKWWVGVLLALWVGWLVFLVGERDYRVTQLECALAQAHGEADTLEAVIERLEQGDR